MIDQLYLLEPPYDRLRPARGGHLPLGTIITADLTGEGADRVTAALDALALHRESPWCPVCFVADGTAPGTELVAALGRFPGSAAWVAGAVGPRPMAEDVAEAVRSRVEPDAEGVREFITFRLGGSSELAATAFETAFAPAAAPNGDFDVDQLRREAGDEALDAVGWEAVVESLLRRRGYVRGPEGTSPELVSR